MTLDEVRSCLLNRRYDDLHPNLTNALELIEDKYEINLTNYREKLCNLLRIFYSENFLLSINELWSF